MLNKCLPSGGLCALFINDLTAVRDRSGFAHPTAAERRATALAWPRRRLPRARSLVRSREDPSGRTHPMFRIPLAMSLLLGTALPAAAADAGLWRVYEKALKGAKYIDLTHTITPTIPVWAASGPSTFGPTRRPRDRQALHLREGRLRGHALPARHRPARHPARSARPLGARVSRRSTSCPATYAVRPLVVISIVDQVAKDPGYHLTVADVGRLGAAARPDPRRLGRLRPLRLVEGLARPGARHATPFPRRRRSTRSSSSTCSATSSSTATSRSTPTPRPTSKARPG